ncbi:slr1601 family putative cell division protein [Gloeomargarita sp.]
MASPSVVRVPPVQELVWGFVIQGLVGSGMLMALVRLLPYYQQQQQRHHLLQTEIERTEIQVRELQTEFQRTFDPHQQPRLIQKATQRLQPHQRQVIWVKPR